MIDSWTAELLKINAQLRCNGHFQKTFNLRKAVYVDALVWRGTSFGPVHLFTELSAPIITGACWAMLLMGVWGPNIAKKCLKSPLAFLILGTAAVHGRKYLTVRVCVCVCVHE